MGARARSKFEVGYFFVPRRLCGAGNLDHRPDLEPVIPSLKCLGLCPSVECQDSGQQMCACADVWMCVWGGKYERLDNTRPPCMQHSPPQPLHRNTVACA